MDKLRAQVTLTLVTLLVTLTLVQAYDCVIMGGNYEVPVALFGVVGTAVGGLYAPDLVARLRGKSGNGNGDKSNGKNGQESGG